MIQISQDIHICAISYSIGITMTWKEIKKIPLLHCVKALSHNMLIRVILNVMLCYGGCSL